MTDFRTATSLGERIQAARKARGMSARELAEAIGGVPTQSTIENIELGRKAAIDIAQLLNIAMAVQVPLSYLLAPMGNPSGPLDVPNLSEAFSQMTVIEFDSWLSGNADGAYLPVTVQERNAVEELQTIRAWSSQRIEILRLEATLEVARTTPRTAGSYTRSTEDRLVEAQKELDRLAKYLRSAGWDL